jgi:hypothetical protein
VVAVAAAAVAAAAVVVYFAFLYIYNNVCKLCSNNPTVKNEIVTTGRS